MWYFVIASYIAVLIIGFLIGIFLSISINKFLVRSEMDLKLPLFTARINGAAVFSQPLLFKDKPDAEHYILEAIKEMNPDATCDELKLIGYFNPFTGELEVVPDEEKTVEEGE